MAAVPDLRSKRIPVWIPGLFFAASVAAELFEAGCSAKLEFWAGAVPGALLLLLSLILRGRIGEGDGICLMVCGLFTGVRAALLISEMALVMAALTCMIGVFTGKRKAGDRIAFIPFLASAGSLFLIAGVLMSV
jgi:leader peptidase (prepilin peptidase)/N-methyltransferase